MVIWVPQHTKRSPNKPAPGLCRRTPRRAYLSLETTSRAITNCTAVICPVTPPKLLNSRAPEMFFHFISAPHSRCHCNDRRAQYVNMKIQDRYAMQSMEQYYTTILALMIPCELWWFFCRTKNSSTNRACTHVCLVEYKLYLLKCLLNLCRVTNILHIYSWWVSTIKKITIQPSFWFFFLVHFKFLKHST